MSEGDLSYRLQASGLLLKWSGQIDHEKILALLQRTGELTWHSIVRETSTHTHAACGFRQRRNIRSVAHFDLDGVHPDVTKLTSKIDAINIYLEHRKKGNDLLSQSVFGPAALPSVLTSSLTSGADGQQQERRNDHVTIAAAISELRVALDSGDETARKDTVQMYWEVLEVELSKDERTIADFIATGGLCIVVKALKSNCFVICGFGCAMLEHIVYFYFFVDPQCDERSICRDIRLLHDAGAFKALINILRRSRFDELLTQRVVHLVGDIILGSRNLSDRYIGIFKNATFTSHLLHAMDRYPFNKMICYSVCDTIYSLCNENVKMKLQLLKWDFYRETHSEWIASDEERTNRVRICHVESILLSVLENHTDLQAVGLMAIYALAFNQKKPFALRGFESVLIGEVIRDSSDFGHLPQYPLYEIVDGLGAEILQHLRDAYVRFTLAPLEILAYPPIDDRPHPLAKPNPSFRGRHPCVGLSPADLFVTAAVKTRDVFIHEMRSLIFVLDRGLFRYQQRTCQRDQRFDVTAADDDDFSSSIIRDSKALLRELTRRLGAYIMSSRTAMASATTNATATANATASHSHDFEALTTAMTREFCACRQRQRDRGAAAYDLHRSVNSKIRACITLATRAFTVYRKGQHNDVAVTEEDNFVALIDENIRMIEKNNMRGYLAQARALIYDFEDLISTMTHAFSAIESVR